MIYRIYGQKDSTIYEQDARRAQNTGADEILEVTKFYDEDTNEVLIGNSRILTQFDITSISESISNGDISDLFFNLQIFEQVLSICTGNHALFSIRYLKTSTIK